jgi:hypothetical protein
MNLALGGSYTGYPSAASVAPSLPAEVDVAYVHVFTLGDPPDPSLSVSTTSSGLVISWPSQSVEWVLEQAKSLTNASWAQIPATQYQTNQTQTFYTVPPPLTTNTFYRLFLQ